jgi:hypothetical protein
MTEKLGQLHGIEYKADRCAAFAGRLDSTTLLSNSPDGMRTRTDAEDAVYYPEWARWVREL